MVTLVICIFISGANFECDRGIVFDTYDECYFHIDNSFIPKSMSVTCEEVEVED